MAPKRFVLYSFAQRRCTNFVNTNNNRLFSSHAKDINNQSTDLVYKHYGDPEKVLEVQNERLKRQLTAGQIRVRFLAAPINPADINMIQGIYPIKPHLPAVGGNEGVARVDEVGPSVTSVHCGDWVIPSAASVGTWRTRAVLNDHDVLKISNRLPLASAATLMVNPSTAYRMLHDYVQLVPGDIIIQNGANSAVGRYVIQIAKLCHWQTVNIIRDRENPDEIDTIRRELSALGADYVLSEREFRKTSRALIGSFEHDIKLALNCVSGESTLMLAAVLGNGGHLVTYGGLSRRPIQIPTAPLIFKDIKLSGFWMSRWYAQATNRVAAVHMMDWLTDHMLHERLISTKCTLVPFERWKSAVADAVKMSGMKQIMVMDDKQ